MKKFFAGMFCAALGLMASMTSCDNKVADVTGQYVEFNGSRYDVTGRYFDEDDKVTVINVDFGSGTVDMKFTVDNSLLGQTVQLAPGNKKEWTLDMKAVREYEISNADQKGFEGWFRIVKNSNANYSVSFEIRSGSENILLKGNTDGGFTYDPRPTGKATLDGKKFDITSKKVAETAGSTLISLGFGEGDLDVDIEFDNSLLGFRIPLIKGTTPWSIDVDTADDSYSIDNEILNNFTGWFRVVKNGNGAYTVFFELFRPKPELVEIEGSVGGQFDRQ